MAESAVARPFQQRRFEEFFSTDNLRSNLQSNPRTNPHGHFFAFQPSSQIPDHLVYGSYGESVGEQIIPSMCQLKNPDFIRRSIRESVKTREQIFTLGVKYRIAQDSQPSITGKMKTHETPYKAALREAMEECGLGFPDPEIFYSTMNRSIRCNTFVFPISLTYPIGQAQEEDMPSFDTLVDTLVDTSQDDYKNRVEIVFYGTLEEFSSVLSRVQSKITAEGDIAGVMAYPISL